MSAVDVAVPIGEAAATATANGAAVKDEVSGRKKLHGRVFYESIGSPKFILAPMVDQSEFAWRILSRSFIKPSSTNDLLAYTPMFHARMFAETYKFRDHHFQPMRASLATPPTPSPSPSPPLPSQLYLDGNPPLDRPLFVQFCANDPEELLEAARYVTPFCDAVDLNLGCPQGIARKGKYGAFLQEDQELIASLIRKLHESLAIPVTAKIRVLETKEQTLAYARNVLDAGASILTVHGRVREAKGHKTGVADWSYIRYLRDNLPPETVLFANGNILQGADIEDCLRVTGADGVMSAEGNLYDPAIFGEVPAVGQEGREYWRGRDGLGGWRMDAVFRRYMDILYKYVLEIPAPIRKELYLPSDPLPPTPSGELGKRAAEEGEEEGPPKKKQKKEKREKCTSPNLLAMQPHLFRLLRPLVAKHHAVRDALARSRAGDIEAFENVLTMVEDVVKSGLREYEATDGASYQAELEKDARLQETNTETGTDTAANDLGQDDNENDASAHESSVAAVKRCKRPWWVVQPYVRPLPREAYAKGSLTLSKKQQQQQKKENATQKIQGKGVDDGVGEKKEEQTLNLMISPDDPLIKESEVCG